MSLKANPWIWCWLACLLVLTGCERWKLGRGDAIPDRPLALAESDNAGTTGDKDHAAVRITSDDFVFFDHEFEEDSSALTLGGQKHLAQVTRFFDDAAHTVVVQQSPGGADVKRDYLRCEIVRQELTRAGKQPGRRVVLGSGVPSAAGPSETPLTPRLARELARARGLERVGDRDAARILYEQLVVDCPAHPEPYHRLAVIADFQRRHPDAQALYAQAIRLDPGNADLFNDLGYSFYLEGRLLKAERALLTATAMRPREARYCNNLGMVYGHLGRFDLALQQFRQAASEADAQYNLAFVLASRDDLTGAKACFSRALAADPSHAPSRDALASFLRAELDPEGRFDRTPVADSGTRWIPYVEGLEGTPSPIRMASHAKPADTPERLPAIAE